MMDWMDKNCGKITLVVISALLVALIFLVLIVDQNQWDDYAKKHHCIAVGHKRGQISTGISMDGKGTIVTSAAPDQTIYQCDAGEIEIR